MKNTSMYPPSEIESIIQKARECGVIFLLQRDTLTLKVPKDRRVDDDLLLLIKSNKEWIRKALGNGFDRIAAGEDDRRLPVPVSYSQEGLWIVDQLEGSLAYHIPVVLRLRGRLDAGALSAALKGIVARHEVLRTVLVRNEGGIFQEVLGLDGWELSWREGERCREDAAGLREYITLLINRPFDLRKDYMLRGDLIGLSVDEHILVLTMHHIASDGWSVPLLLLELEALYREHSGTGLSGLGPLPVQYADYAVWQRRYLSGERLEKGLSYWKDKLKGLPVLRLPSDYPRPAVRGMAGAMAELALEEELGEGLRGLSRQQGVTVFMTLLAAFKVLLYRYSGQEDIGVGSVVANRWRREIEGAIGFFVNTIVLRSEVGKGGSFLSLLERVRRTTLEAYEHQEVPFEKVVEGVVRERDRGSHPLFGVLFVLQNMPEVGSLRLGEMEVEREGFWQGTSKFDMTVSVWEGVRGLKVTIEYRTDLYREETMVRMAGHYKELLRSLTRRPETEIDRLEMLPPAEREEVVEKFNDTAVCCSEDRTLPGWFVQQAETTPEAMAIVYAERELSYRELDERSNRLGHYLRSKGIGRGDLVPVCMERGAEMMVGILGILKTGAAYVPVDPGYPAERIGYILEDTGAAVVVSDRGSWKMLAAREGVEVMEVDGDADRIEEQPATRVSGGPIPEDPAYVIYTSGTTGRPKGVVIGHRSAHGFINWCVKEFISDDADTVYATTSICFDLSIFELFYPLCTGRCVRMLPDGLSIGEYAGIDSRVMLNCVPSVIQSLLKEGMSFKNICTLNMAGESIPPDILEQLDIENIKVRNLYGPTETTTYSTIYHIKKGVPVSIGNPIDNTRIYVLDSTGNPVPVGIPGQLHIAGAGVAHGYLNQPELTEQRFLPDAFANTPDAKMYCTGDLGRWLPDGNIELLGRIDDQVKIRGYRIELGEIERVLLESGMVTQAAVKVKGSPEGDRQLVGYVVSGTDLTREKIIACLQDKLPGYMIPKVWLLLERMPLTPNGKIDKKGLPDPNADELSPQLYIAPGDETEVTLAGIWKGLLDVRRPGVHDDFFMLGGHSLLAVSMISAIRERLEIELSLKDIFENPSISMLAALIRNRHKRSGVPVMFGNGFDRIAAGEDDRRLPVPVSYSQEGLWIVDQLEGSLAYHIPVVLRLRGRLDAGALSAALKGIVARHEVLRTVLVRNEGGIFQEVLGLDGWELSWREGERCREDAAGLREYITLLINRPFDLRKDYMLRGDLIGLSVDEHILVLTMHHIASDGWSVPLLLLELEALYREHSGTGLSGLGPLPVQYADYAVWQRRYLSGERLEKGLSYWKDKLKGLPVLRLPSDYPRPAVRGMAGAMAELALEEELGEGLRGLSRQQGVTVFMTLLAAFKVLLYRYSGQEDIGVGSVVANRWRREIEGAIGFFVNTIVLRSEVGKGGSFLSLLERVRRTTLEAYEHQEVPFEKVVEGVVRERDRGSHPLFGVLFVLQNMPEVGSLRLGEMEVEREGFWQGTSKFDMTVSVWEGVRGLKVTIEYRTDLYREETMVRMAGHYKELLRSLTRRPETEIDRLEMLPPAEREEVVEKFNDTAVCCSEDRTLPGWFVQQAETTPEAMAIVYAERELSYRELDERSNRLGHYLRSKGIGRGDLVPVCMERGAEMMVGILGILKTGAAYVPVDPGYPAERIGYILEDTGAAVVVSDRGSWKMLAAREGVEVMEVDGDADRIEEQPATRVSGGPIPEDPAYVIYTSGTTGRPKGVVIGHRSVVNYIQGQIDLFGIDNTEKILQFSNFSFDASVEQIFIALLSGAALMLIPRNLQSEPGALMRLIGEKGITHLHATPGILSTIDPEADLSALRRVISGGEECPVSLAGVFAPKINFYNKYGPTEATISAAIYNCLSDAPEGNSLPIGKPLANVRIYVLDSAGNPAPVGIPGQLHIAGAGVAHGYLNQPELTEQRFLPDAFANTPDAKMYCTGDLGRWLPDGNIELLGRIDDQVKIRGYRIELGEITCVLDQCPLVSRAVVVARADAAGNKRLMAYIVPRGAFDRKTILSWLQTKIPGHMIPALLFELESLPLTSNGKIDKNKLPDHDDVHVSMNAYIPPRNRTEKMMTGILQKLLNTGRVGIRDNFFEMGGNSLLAIRFASQISREIKVNVDVGKIFTYPTVESLCEFTGREDELSLAVIPRLPEQDHYPLSHAQQRIWIVGHLTGGSIAYNIPGAIRLQGDVKVGILRQAFGMIVGRHEVLRTIFTVEDDAPCQRILPAAACDPVIREVDLRDNNAADQTIRKAIEEEARHSFDLSDAPLFRCSLFRTGDDNYVLVFNTHHLVSDGWSKKIFIGEVLENYRSCLSANGGSLPPLSIQYKDYAVWQADTCHEQGKYWRSVYAGGIPSLELPLDFPRPETLSYSGNIVQISVSAGLTARLKKMAVERNTTLHSLLLSSYSLLVAAYSGTEDVVIGTMVSGRDHPDLEDLIGVFINFLPIRLFPQRHLTLTEFTENCHRLIAQSFSNQGYPFDLMVNDCIRQRDRSRNPFFDTMFNFHWDMEEITGGKETTWPEGMRIMIDRYDAPEVDLSPAMMDCRLDVEPLDDRLDLKLRYNTTLFTGERMSALLDAYLDLLETIVEEPGKKLMEYLPWKENKKNVLSVVCCASFVPESIAEYLLYWGNETGLELQLQFAPYNQVFQQLLHPDSLLNRNTGINILFVRVEDWLRGLKDKPAPEQIAGLDESYAALISAMEQHRSISGTSFFAGVVPVSCDKRLSPEVTGHISGINKQLEHFFSGLTGAYLCDLEQAATLYAVEEMFDVRSDETDHIPFTPEYDAALGTFIARKIRSWKGPHYKVIVLDCDNTLWKGICGEDGVEGLRVDAGFSCLQEFVLEKHREGFILALCSKNNEADVWEIFDKHPGMQLRREHITAHRINWRPKPENILAIAEELNVGTDSIIFLDDSSFETEQVSLHSPEVLSLTLPQDPGEWKDFLHHIWAFDRLTVTAEDLGRNRMYEVERHRKQEREKYARLDDFIASLGIRIDIRSLREQDMERALQLMQRTNQFNLNGLVRTRNEIASLMCQSDSLNWVVEVKDRFGDYGLTGLLFAGSRGNSLVIQSFLLSCRVLGRKVEDFIAGQLEEYRKIQGLEDIQALFRQTPKNAPFQRFLSTTGWKI